MLRRILIIILVVVVIIAAIFAIRWFLNRDSGSEEATDEPAGVVEGTDVDVTNDEAIVVEDGDTSEAPVAEDDRRG